LICLFLETKCGGIASANQGQSGTPWKAQGSSVPESQKYPSLFQAIPFKCIYAIPIYKRQTHRKIKKQKPSVYKTITPLFHKSQWRNLLDTGNLVKKRHSKKDCTGKKEN